MHVEPFNDQYEATAPLYGMSPADLLARDRRSDDSPARWIAIDRDIVLGAASVWWRPDDRVFVDFVGSPSTIGSLTAAVSTATSRAASTRTGRPLHVQVDVADTDRFDACSSAGFVTEVATESFTIRFDAALRLLAKARVPPGFSIISTDQADLDRLVTLDNAVRHDVPGIDGWQGDLARLLDDIAESPPFDPSAYLVGVDDATGEYAGLVRIWRNRSGPRFGLVGVARPYRRTMLGASLIRRALEAAATWGSATFAAETSPSNEVIHPRMQRLGAVRTGRFAQMIHPTDGAVQ